MNAQMPATRTAAASSPIFMIEPCPNWRSIWVRAPFNADSRALAAFSCSFSMRISSKLSEVHTLGARPDGKFAPLRVAFGPLEQPGPHAVQLGHSAIGRHCGPAPADRGLGGVNGSARLSRRLDRGDRESWPGHRAHHPEYARRRPPRWCAHRARGIERAGGLDARGRGRRSGSDRRLGAGVRGAQAAGAAYLVLLGVRALRDAVRPRVAPGPRIARPGVDPAVPADRMSAASSKPSAAFRQGLLSDLGNPKMAVFFTSLLPQFAPRGGGFLAMSGLGLLFCLLTFAWLALYASVVARASDLLRRPRVKRTLDALMGTALVGLGVRIAGQQRPG